ncbi:unnamed protein product [Thelazia callipaeda]|uniref:Major sperm protein n=1 Tax=Thelazia callipaeda TaxID=103827 RepID=A0A0N5CV29_THECL|nr:unnamed protein product [Thelazia callipaeda]
MSYPKEIIFPTANKLVVRRLLLRNATRMDFAVKLRTNSAALVPEPSQGFLRAGHTQSVLLRFNSAKNASVVLNHLNNSNKDSTIFQKQTLKIYCRTVNRKTEADCRRWFLSPTDESKESHNQLAQTLKIKTSKGFTPLETVLDLPCMALIIQAQQYPVLTVDDSDTVTAHQIDSDTNTACMISESELLEMLPPDCTISTAKGIEEASWNNNSFWYVTSRPICGVLEKFFDSIFPPDDRQEAIAPCGATR